MGVFSPSERCVALVESAVNLRFSALSMGARVDLGIELEQLNGTFW